MHFLRRCFPREIVQRKESAEPVNAIRVESKETPMVLKLDETEGKPGEKLREGVGGQYKGRCEQRNERLKAEEARRMQK